MKIALVLLVIALLVWAISKSIVRKRKNSIQELLKQLNKRSPREYKEVVEAYADRMGLRFQTDPQVKSYDGLPYIVLSVLFEGIEEPWEFYRVREGPWRIVDKDTFGPYNREFLRITPLE